MICAADGYQLSALYSEADQGAKGTAVISSATGVKKEFYINFGLFLVEQGYNVLLFDYRGIGGSAPRDLKSSPIFMHDWGIKDMNAVMRYLVETCGCVNITWIGHSIGAQLTGFIEHHHYIRKVVAINAAVGYWGYFPFPMNLGIWMMWYLVSPLMLRLYGYGKMRQIGWGEDLPRNALIEWRDWCTDPYYYRKYVNEALHTDRFYHFTGPVTAIYTSDDYIANDKTVSMMMQFFPNATVSIRKIWTSQYTRHKVGHTGLFRRKFKDSLWPLIVESMQ
ncbi:alpha/beta hydrolase family protein [Chryseolinea sp. T2]|uniref:alpha/beta hydrolase family protein n=1 Tax=Chryseolinea sp. T2 TaxID=3129255 RepID=UPI003078168E